ncbi:hypothetical protein ES708_30647 [subsurface metagenome]
MSKSIKLGDRYAGMNQKEFWKAFRKDMKEYDEKLNIYLDTSGEKQVRIKKVYPGTLLEWHEPKTDLEEKLYWEHDLILNEVRITGKCPCGASVEKNSGNYLQDLGYFYGVECLICR